MDDHVGEWPPDGCWRLFIGVTDGKDGNGCGLGSYSGGGLCLFRIEGANPNRAESESSGGQLGVAGRYGGILHAIKLSATLVKGRLRPFRQCAEDQDDRSVANAYLIVCRRNQTRLLITVAHYSDLICL